MKSTSPDRLLPFADLSRPLYALFAAVLLALVSTAASARAEEWQRPVATPPPPPPPPRSSTAVDVATGFAIGGGIVALAGSTLVLGTFVVFGTEDPSSDTSEPTPPIAEALLITGGVAAGAGLVTCIASLFVRMGLLASRPAATQPAQARPYDTPRIAVDVSDRGARVGLAWSF